MQNPSKLVFIDTHSHLDDNVYDGKLDQVLLRAKENNVEAIIIPSTNLDSAKKIVKIVEHYNKLPNYPKLFFMVGVHPHDANSWNSDSEKEVLSHLTHQFCLGIGEIGLDYYYNFSDKISQKIVFKTQLEIAKSQNQPVTIHFRNAFEDLFQIIKDTKISTQNLVLHCFTGSFEEANVALSNDLKFSIGGIITFSKSDNLREVFRKIPIENIILETDSPYLTPHPFRGKINEPSNIKYIYEKLLEIKRDIVYNQHPFVQILNNVKQIFPKICNFLNDAND